MNKSSKDVDRKKEILILMIFILISITLMSGSSDYRGRIGSAIGDVLFYPALSVIDFFQELANFITQSEELKVEITNLNLKMALNESYKIENQRLKEMLGFIDSTDLQLIPARLIGVVHDNFKDAVIVNKGIENGVRYNAPAITPQGVVGKVIQVAGATSTVQLISDEKFRVSTMLERIGFIGILKRKYSKYYAIDNVPPYLDIKKGDNIITSGIGGIFPKGLKIGVVENVIKEPTSAFNTIKVKLNNDLSLVEDICIIK